MPDPRQLDPRQLDPRHLDPRLAHQSRARPLTEAEQRLAHVLEEILATGTHDFAAVADALQARGIEQPSGATGAWTLAMLVEEVGAINASLDAAYAETGIGV